MRCFTAVNDQHIYIDEVTEEFLTRLGELVKRSGYSELDIANKLHVHETLPRAWRIRKSAPSVGTFLRLAGQIEGQNAISKVEGKTFGLQGFG